MRWRARRALLSTACRQVIWVDGQGHVCTPLVLLPVRPSRVLASRYIRRRRLTTPWLCAGQCRGGARPLLRQEDPAGQAHDVSGGAFMFVGILCEGLCPGARRCFAGWRSCPAGVCCCKCPCPEFCAITLVLTRELAAAFASLQLHERVGRGGGQAGPLLPGGQLPLQPATTRAKDPPVGPATFPMLAPRLGSFRFCPCLLHASRSQLSVFWWCTTTWIWTPQQCACAPRAGTAGTTA